LRRSAGPEKEALKHCKTGSGKTIYVKGIRGSDLPKKGVPLEEAYHFIGREKEK